jgi:hypothetical protein
MFANNYGTTRAVNVVFLFRSPLGQQLFRFRGRIIASLWMSAASVRLKYIPRIKLIQEQVL